MPSRLIACLCLLFLSVLIGEFAVASPEISKQKHRRYDQGPLRIDDFRRNPPDSILGKALTRTRVMFTYKFRMNRVSPDQFEAKLTSLDTYAVFLPKESWWNHRVSETLLDHEQGHFDIAEITARRLQLVFDQMFKSNQAISATARSAALAKQGLAEKLDKVISMANEQSLRDNEEYDNRTSHGLRENVQSKYRRAQLLTLSKLQEKLIIGKGSRKSVSSSDKR